MKDKEQKLSSAGNAPLLEIKGLFIRFVPHSPEFGNRDWFKELQKKYNKGYDDLTEKEQEEVQLAYHSQACLCWRLDYISDGKKYDVGQAYYLDFEKEKQWQSELKFGTYYLSGDKAISYKRFRRNRE